MCARWLGRALGCASLRHPKRRPPEHASRRFSRGTTPSSARLVHPGWKARGTSHSRASAMCRCYATHACVMPCWQNSPASKASLLPLLLETPARRASWAHPLPLPAITSCDGHVSDTAFSCSDGEIRPTQPLLPTWSCQICHRALVSSAASRNAFALLPSPVPTGTLHRH